MGAVCLVIEQTMSSDRLMFRLISINTVERLCIGLVLRGFYNYSYSDPIYLLNLIFECGGMHPPHL